MSSPPAPAQSTKRPLEDPSSPSGPTDQPDAKRPALDKVTKGEDNEEKKPAGKDSEARVVSSNGDTKGTDSSTNGTKVEAKDEQGDVPGRP